MMADMITQEKAKFTTANAFDGLEVIDASYQKQNFSKHVHESYTIGLIQHGAQKFYRSGGEHIAPQNSIILVNADDVHNGQSATEGGWKYRAMYPTLEQFEMVTQDLYEGKRQAPYFNFAVVEDERLAQQLKILFEQIDANSSKLLIETLLYSILMSMTLNHSRNHSLPNELSGNKANLILVKEYLDAYPEQDVPLKRLAEIAGLSQYHFVRQFKKAFELAPHSYQIQARLKKSKTLLKAGIKPADVATDCGFHDQSHFHRHFKKALGVTPSQYQKQATLYKPF